MSVAVAPRANPYPGLTAFAESDATRFFGRDQEIEEILDRFASRRLLAIIGVSGCGKSSLVRAGVIPVLKMGVAANLASRWQIHTMSPGLAPIEALRTSIGAPADWPATSFGLIDHARKILSTGETLLVIVDQFEELFQYRDDTMGEDGGNRASLFVNMLLNAVQQREIPIYVLLTMRTDFLGKCSQFRGLPEALNDCYYLVPRMTRLQQQEAVERPLQEQGATMHPAVVQRLLNDSAEDPDHLPVLQHLLKRLWENWSGRIKEPGEPISDKDYKAVGGWADALNDDAEAVLKKFADDQEGIRRLFQWITERGIGEQPVRRPRAFSECVRASGLSPERLKEIVVSFQNRGLLRPSDLVEKSLVDLPHESVMWQWSRLKGWIAEEAEHAAQLRFFLQAANQGIPLTGLALESASEWRHKLRAERYYAQRYLKPQEVRQTKKWIVRSERIQRWRRCRRRWMWVGIAILVALFTVIGNRLAVKFALQNQAERILEEQRNSAEARELLAWAGVSLNEDPGRSLILGLYSWHKQQKMIPGLEAFLHQALLQSLSQLTIRGHQAPVRSAVWSPDGSKIATASEDKTAKVWRVKTGRELFSLSVGSPVLGVAWSPDGTKLATASENHLAEVWDAATGGKLLTLTGHRGSVMSISWSVDGRKLATASEDRTARIWDAATGREILTLRGHHGPIMSVAWSPDGNKIATASQDHTAKIWDSIRGRMLITLRGHRKFVLGIDWSPDGSKVATASADNTVKLWETKKGLPLMTLHGHQASVWNIVWSLDGTKLATASSDSTAKIWEVLTGRELLTLRGHQAPVRSICWSPDGDTVVTGSQDRTAKVWQIGTGWELLTLRGHQGPVRSVAWSPDGKRLASGSYDHTTKVWDANTGRELLSLRNHKDSVLNAAWSPKGDMLATASADHTTDIWNIEAGQLYRTLYGHQDAVRDIAWSPDQAKLATASSDNTVRVWELRTGRQLLVLRGHEAGVWGIAWSADGSKLATASSDGTAKVWDVETGGTLLTLSPHQGQLRGIVWSADGNKLATIGDENTVKVWQARTGRELLTLHGHQAGVRSAAWSPDGKKIVTGSDDNTVKIWDAGTGQEIVTLHGHQDAVLSVAWSPDNKYLAASGADKIVQIYVVDQMELLHLVRSRVSREPTIDECQRYLHVEKCPPLPNVP